ncbi:hypothetical protein MMC31_008184 [Peltigera leucophlebia]|nr:hypothetical protein [Peltigera leucophlebia]
MLYVGDWRLADGQVNEQQVDNPAQIDEVPESSNPGDKSIDAEYVLEDSNQVKTGMEIDDRKSDSELEQGNLEDEEDFLFAMG